LACLKDFFLLRLFQLIQQTHQEFSDSIISRIRLLIIVSFIGINIMKISLIAAMTPGNHVIGKNNQIPWKLPSDMKKFKELTTGKAVVMGRKTYESIGRPLPNRINIVITSQKYKADGFFVANSIDEAIQIAKDNSVENLMVIGGNGIYTKFMDFADELLLTFVLEALEGDTCFPAIDNSLYKMVECSDPLKGENDECFHVFCKFEKI